MKILDPETFRKNVCGKLNKVIRRKKLSFNFNSKWQTDVIYFDFAKASDSVNHDILLNKLKHSFNINGHLLRFIVNYLKGRKQRVIIDGEFSASADVDSGVPQGSILGPLLFVLFINDLQSVVSPGTHIALYADDTQVWRQIITESDCHILNQDICSLTEWAEANRMKFHPQKCKILSVGPKIFLDSLPFQRIYPYYMENMILDHVDYETDLGLIVNEKLNWSRYHNVILSKAITQFNLLRRTCHFVKNPVKKRTLYLTTVRSLFEHVSVIWSPTQENTLNKFEPIQKRCVKWILNEQFQSYSEIEYLKRLLDFDIMPLVHKFAFNDLKLFYKICKGLVPIVLPDYIVVRTNTRSSHFSALVYGLRSEDCCTTTVFSHSFFPRCISLWNALPVKTRSSKSLQEFLSNLKSHIWDNVKISIEGD